jgi:hypothetical protein
MKIILVSLICIILQEIGFNGNMYSYKAVTEKGDTGTLFSGKKLSQGDTVHLKWEK